MVLYNKLNLCLVTRQVPIRHLYETSMSLSSTADHIQLHTPPHSFASHLLKDAETLAEVFRAHCTVPFILYTAHIIIPRNCFAMTNS